MYEFNYHRPSSIDEAKNIIADNDEAKLLAGGMTLLPTMKLRLAGPTDLVDLAGIESLRQISEASGHIEIGAMVTHAEVATSDVVKASIPALAGLAGSIGDAQVRHRGTLGGSVSNNDPAADYPAAVLALDAVVVTDRREISSDEWIRGMFETALETDEIVTSVRFPIPTRAAYAKFPNPASRYAIAGVMVAETAQGVRVAVTGAGASAFRATELEAALSSDFSAAAIEGMSVSSADLNSDLHASSAYRAHLVVVMAKRAVAAAS